jgi:hypothetical protein
MAYIKKIWKDYPDTTTQIKAEDLNNIENGIVNLNVADSGIITIDGTGASGRIEYAKVGRIVQLFIDSKITTTVSGVWKTIVLKTLPDNLKPLTSCMTTAARDSQSTLLAVGVSSSGNVYISDRGRGNLTSSTEAISATLTYISVE